MSCPNCAEGGFLPGKPEGTFQSELQNAYYSPAPGAEGPTKRAVLLLTDAFGLPLTNCKIMADEMAKRLGCDVWIPDYFNGRPLFPVPKMEAPDKVKAVFSTWDWIYFFFRFALPNIFNILSNREHIVDKRLESFVALLKEKKGYEKLGAIGYCFGGSACIRLGTGKLVDTIVIAHPGPFTLDQVKAFKIPNSWVCAEVDMFFPDSLRHASEAELASRKGRENEVEYEFKEYKGTAHGFASRPNLGIPGMKESWEGALEQTVEWFKKTLLA